MPIKSFRGLLTDASQETIRLHTITGKTGYRITKFQIFPNNFNETDEYAIKIFSIEQTATSTTFNFSDPTLLASAYFENGAGVGSEGTFHNTVVFDSQIINQDIFVTLASQSGKSCNYYLELEQIKLDSNETAVATLKNIKNRG